MSCESDTNAGGAFEPPRARHYLAGNELTAADIMLVFSLTTMRSFTPFDLKPYPNILAYLRRIGAREAYQRAMRKADPEMKLLLD